jgi:hypothetical protein
MKFSKRVVQPITLLLLNIAITTAGTHCFPYCNFIPDSFATDYKQNSTYYGVMLGRCDEDFGCEILRTILLCV